MITTDDAVIEAEVMLGEDGGTVRIDGADAVSVSGAGEQLRDALLQEVTGWAVANSRSIHVVAIAAEAGDRAEFMVSSTGQLEVIPVSVDDELIEPQSDVDEEPSTPRRAYDFGDDEELATSPLAEPLGEPLIILVANTKGESGKTPLAVLLGQAFGSLRPGDVAVLDLDPTGNLAARAGTGRSTPTLPNMVEAAAVESSEWSDITRLLAWHPESRMWVVAARDPEGTQQTGHLPAGALSVAVDALAKGVRIIILDAGNDERAPIFREAAALADQLVVPVRWDVPTVRDGAGVLLRSLYANGYQDLATQAIIVGTYPLLRRPPRRQEQRFRAEFQRMGHRIVDVPSDAHIDERGGIAWARLRSRTRRSALALAEQVSAREPGKRRRPS